MMNYAKKQPDFMPLGGLRMKQHRWYTKKKIVEQTYFPLIIPQNAHPIDLL